MNEEMKELRLRFQAIGLLLPEWLLRLNPRVDNSGDYVVVEDEIRGNVYFPAEQFSLEQVRYRNELITKHGN